MKLFKYFNFLNNKKVDFICRKYGIKNYTINKDGSVDVNGDVDIRRKGLTEIPLKFRNVSGNFFCNDNQLTSLEGAPQSVNNFDCSYNKLNTLEGSPQSVNGDFSCFSNKLTSLEGSPKSIGNNFRCTINKLTSLEGCPQSIGNNFDISNNQLISLKGWPQKIGGGFICYNNKLRDVYGVKEGWGGYFEIEANPVEEIFKLFPLRYSEVVELLNEYNVIRDGKYVVLQALEMVFIDMDLDIPEIENIKGYEII
jgi:hypothetical protein